MVETVATVETAGVATVAVAISPIGGWFELAFSHFPL